MKQLTRLTLVCAVLLLGDVTLTSSSVKADAICQDGWYSSSEGSGTCSHHGGVSQWIDNSPVIPDFSPTPAYSVPSYYPVPTLPYQMSLPIITYPSPIVIPTIAPRTSLPVVTFTSFSPKSRTSTSSEESSNSGASILGLLAIGAAIWFFFRKPSRY